MAGQSDIPGTRLDEPLRGFDPTGGSVFDGTPFIDDAALVPAAAPARVPRPDRTAGRSWQSAAGGRLLTPAEQAARERYFEAKAFAAIERVRRSRRPSAA